MGRTGARPPRCAGRARRRPPLLDTGEVAPAVRELYPDGVDAALELVGTPTLPDTLRAVRVHGTACFGGSLPGQWTVRDFSPNEYLPKGVRLAGYFGDDGHRCAVLPHRWAALSRPRLVCQRP